MNYRLFSHWLRPIFNSVIQLFNYSVILLIAAACTQKNKLPVQDEAPKPVLTKQARLVFAGDLMQHRPQVFAARNESGEFDYSESFGYVKNIFQEADIAILNFETTLTPYAHYTGYPLFRSPAQLADALQDMGIDVAVMANNHVCDNGRVGMEFTMSRLDSLGIAYTGAFIDSIQYQQRHPLLIHANGLRFALFNYTYDTNGMPVPAGAIVNLIDSLAIANDLEKVDRTHIDCVIVFFHWGDEYVRHPNREQQKLAALCHRHGAEIVIGSHPHVIQPIDIQMDADSVIRSVTVYSLGNLVSNQRNRYRDGGIIVTLDIRKTENEPVRIEPYYTPVWVLLPKYRILPPAVADTLQMPEYQRSAYQRFVEDTREHLGYERLFREK